MLLFRINTKSKIYILAFLISINTISKFYKITNEKKRYYFDKITKNNNK